MSDLVTHFGNQTVRHQRLVAADSFQGNTYDPATLDDADEILAVYEPASGLTRTLGGDEVAVESRVLTKTPVALGDLIEGWRVRRVVPFPLDFDGTTTGYEVFL